MIDRHSMYVNWCYNQFAFSRNHKRFGEEGEAADALFNYIRIVLSARKFATQCKYANAVYGMIKKRRMDTDDVKEVSEIELIAVQS